MPRAALVSAASLMPQAEIRTPYGMTEALPVADVELATIPDVGTAEGVPVGHPVIGVKLAIAVLDDDRTELLRQVTGVDLAAVLVRGALPVDIRHNSKIDRTLLATWAERILAGAGG